MRRTVAIVYGGRSGEHDVSIRSAQSILKAIRSAESILSAIDRAKYDVKEFFINPEGKWRPHAIVPEPGANPGVDVVFPVLHGTFGEDGTVQGLFELADLPYVGAGVLGSAAAMDKEIAMVEDRLPYPVFVKPANLGSSVGISKARNRAELEEALRLAARYDRKVIVERGIEGRELECSVLGNAWPEASLPCEIRPFREFYDYEDKYILDKTEFRIPAELSAERTARLRELAIAAYQAVECEGMARVDFLFEEGAGRLYVNEINTIPGFTSISMYPKMWEHSGISYQELIDRLWAGKRAGMDSNYTGNRGC